MVTRTSLSDALALGADAWAALEACCAWASPFAGWSWHRAWAASATPAERSASQALLAWGPDGGLQGVLPLTVRRRRWRRLQVPALEWTIGDAGCPDHLDLLMTPDADAGAVAAALDTLPWRVAVFDNIAGAAPNLERVCAALARRGHAVRDAELWPCPRLALPGSWEAYLGSLSPNRRQTLRRKERKLLREHGATITDYAGERLAEGWRHLLRLHDERWSGAGAFGDPRAEALQRAFAGDLATRSRVWLTTLDVAGTPVAAWYGFDAGDTVYFYQSGRDPRWEEASVGQVLMGLMIRRAIERGFRWFDFLRGDDPYKRHWTGDRRMTRSVTVFRRGWGGAGLRAIDWLAERRHRV
ncbi:MAG TPA: GNAT family N-acetyltransferase [Gemmatimonadales bacterium]